MFEVITFLIDGQQYALPAAEVHEVEDPSRITLLPFVPAFVEGLVNIAGRVVPQVDLGIRLGHARRLAANQGKVLLVRCGTDWCAARVDQVLDRVQTVDISTQPRPQEFVLDGISIRLLAPDILGLDDILPTGVPNGEGGLLGSLQASRTVSAPFASESSAFLLIGMDGERFALSLQRVLNVVEVSDHEVLLYPCMEIVGSILWRGEALLILDLAMLLMRKHTTANVGFIVVADIRGGRFGLAVERLIGIHRVPQDRMQWVARAEAELEGYISSGDHGLIGVLGLDGLITQERFMRYSNYLVKNHDKPTVRVPQTAATLSLLLFRLGEETCALPLEKVVRVEEHERMTALPVHDDPVLVGVLQSRGEILPVVDLCLACGLVSASRQTTSTATYILARTQWGRWAVRVDRVERIAELAATDIEPVMGRSHDYLESIARFHGKLVSVFTLAPLDRIQTVATPLNPYSIVSPSPAIA